MMGFLLRAVLATSLFLLSFFDSSEPPLPGGAKNRSTPENTDLPDNVYGEFDTIHTPLGDYLWPTDATRIVTSTFGEYRRTHFHAGIDISTNSATGYSVLAARDGYVSQISISPGGYGKILYIRHNDGFVTAYAHLKAFSGRIDTLVRREQLRLEQFPVDFSPEPGAVPVQEGETVAYSGSSGSGPAHLHFEIRDENFNPLNPLMFKNIAVRDSLRPEIRSIAIVPLGPHSNVAARQRPSILRGFRRASDTYHVREKIRVRGYVGIEINTRDRIDGTWHRVGIHRLQLFVDDSLRFTARLDRIAGDETKQILMFYDLSLLRKGMGKYQKLYVEEGAALPIFERMPHGAGIIDTDQMEEGEHSFRVVCADIAGNSAELRGILVTERSGGTGQPVLAPGRSRPDPPTEEVFALPPDGAGWVSFDRDSLQIVYDSGAVFKPLNVRITENRTRGFRMYKLEPRDVLLNRGVRVFVRSGHPGSTSCALYWRAGDRWELLPTSYDSVTQYFSAPLDLTLGEIALLEDGNPPRVGGLRIETRGKRVSVRFTVHDDRSGIDAEEIKMYIDDAFVIPEIDAERWRVRYDALEPLPKGKHALRIVAKDNMRNTASLTQSFTVN